MVPLGCQFPQQGWGDGCRGGWEVAGDVDGDECRGTATDTGLSGMGTRMKEGTACR